MHIEIEDKSKCCGCTACMSTCPKDAIRFVPDILGFKYPVVDEDLCIECGKCIDVCQFYSNYERFGNYSEPLIYGLRCKSNSELSESQSGGAFFLISEAILRQKGVVYGAIIDENKHVRHIKASDIETRNLQRGAKYTQSELGKTFREIKEDLREGNIVLFTGTPCQVAGLKAYVGPHLSKQLYCVDLLCHGVPSPKIWMDYLHYLERKYKGRIVKAVFRDKKTGWKGAKESYIINGKRVFSTSFLDLYFSHNISRDCCSKCPYTNFYRVGDISVGDFWGWEKTYSKFNDNKGVSLVLINSEKGKSLFESIQQEAFIQKSNKKECLQNVLSHPIPHNPNREKFIHEYERFGVKYILKKYTQEGWRLRLKTKIASLIRK